MSKCPSCDVSGNSKGDGDSPSPARDAGGDSSMPDPGPADDVWAPTTVPYDPECKTGCEPLATGDYGHLGELEISYNPDVDDAIAQWADCLESFQGCLFVGRDGLECSQESSCPASCRADYESRIAGVSDAEAQHDLFAEVYVEDGAPCLPSVEAQP